MALSGLAGQVVNRRFQLMSVLPVSAASVATRNSAQTQTQGKASSVMASIRKVGIIGGGVIGAGWAARLVLNGINVAVSDPDPEAERKIEAVLANATRAFNELIDAPLPERGTLRLVSTVEDAVSDADFIQESLPEREALKQEILALVSKAAPVDTIIASSTSGLLPSRIQSAIEHPGRFCVGHPFNPVYLMPLVEVCGGDKTTSETVAGAISFYRQIGMQPLHVRKEIDGFIADRLMEALWREALWLVKDGIATTGEIDDAMRFGPGLRWAFMGTMLTYRLAGGEAGMEHFLAQFGPTLKLPWTKLMDVPELDEALIGRIAEQSDAQAGDADLRTLERKRDDCLVAIMQALKHHDYGAGQTLAAYEQHLNKNA